MKTSEKIIRAAYELYLEKGLGGFSIRDVSKRAGAPIGAIYYHFKNKRELENAVEQMQLDRIIGYITPLMDKNIDPYEKIFLIGSKIIRAIYHYSVTAKNNNTEKMQAASMFFIAKMLIKICEHINLVGEVGSGKPIEVSSCGQTNFVLHSLMIGLCSCLIFKRNLEEYDEKLLGASNIMSKALNCEERNLKIENPMKKKKLY